MWKNKSLYRWCSRQRQRPDADLQGLVKRENVNGIETHWSVTIRPGKRPALDTGNPVGAVLDQLEHIKARIRAKVKHPFRVIK